VSDRSKVFLKDRRTGEFVESVLIDGVIRAEVEAAEAAWRPIVEEKVAQLRQGGAPESAWPEHSHWDWRKKHEAIEGLIAYRMFGLKCGSEMQGLMLVSTAGHVCRIPVQANKDLVYIDFVASAPWNSAGIAAEPRYGLIGSVFIATAIQLSLSEGFKGRIGLHSLPQAEKFYAERCRMTDLGRDRKKENLRYFEMTPEQASGFLR
jgi:hypothetical protein